MRLQSQLNIAFTTLLLIVMLITGYTSYSIVLNTLIENEGAKLEEKGELLVHVLTNEEENEQDLQQFSQFLEEQDLQLFLYNRHSNQLLYSSLSKDMTEGFIRQNDFSNNEKGLWTLGNDKFVTSRILFYPEEAGVELIMLTPLTQLQAVQKDFIQQMTIVFFIGSLVAITISYLLTNKLVTPLTRVKKQLRQIEQRQFANIEPIQATGEIKEVSESVSQMAHELQLYIDSQQTFFQNASHELKTPLMTIQGYVEGIRDGVFDGLDASSAYESIIQEIKRLKHIINEMTLLAKLDSEKAIYQKKETSIRQCIQSVFDRTKLYVHTKEITIVDELETDVLIRVDEEKLMEAIMNIVNNAIRHAEQMIEIHLTERDGLLSIVISDDGNGIKEELQPHIFHRFVKGKDGETGLGLAIARAIVEGMDGRLFLGSSVYSGASFYMEFPILQKSSSTS